MQPNRQPTVDQAVEYLQALILRESRIAQLRDYREKFGEAFAKQVAAKYREKTKGMKTS